MAALDNKGVKANSVRTSIDLPQELHRRLHEAAARQGCSERQLILTSIESVVERSEPAERKGRLDLSKGLVPPDPRRLPITAKQIYDLVVYP